MTTRQGNTDVTATSGMIDVGDTELYYELRGGGPPLLLISGGTGDAGDWGSVQSTLAGEFMVVSYDRRGYSRSPRPDGWTDTSIEEQADDAAALLRALDLAPATIIGHSAGGAILCSLVARHPALVRRAVFYEPALLAVVPDGGKMVESMMGVIEQAMAEGGPRHAMETFMRVNAGDQAFEAWCVSVGPAVRDRVLDNATVLFPTDLPALGKFVPDREKMRETTVPLTVVVGEENRNTWMGIAAAWLEEGAGASRIELPGGHAGFATHPNEFVQMARRTAG